MAIENSHTPDVVRSGASVFPLILLVVAVMALTWAAYTLIPQLAHAWSELPALTQTPATPAPSTTP